MENYRTLRSLGQLNETPPVISALERGEEPYVRDHQEAERPADTCSGSSGVTGGPCDGDHMTGSPPTGDVECVIIKVEESDIDEEEDDLPEPRVAPRRIPTPEKPFSCSECGKRFVMESRFRRHRCRAEKPFTCSQCGKRFMTEPRFLAHRCVPPGEKPYSCPECTKSFVKHSHFLRHQSIHTGEKPFSCFLCGKCFRTKSYLVTHQRTHTGEKPFTCEECGKSFRAKCYLIIHQRIHSGEKPFSCSVCGKSFISTSDFVRHQRVHTGEKPFSCAQCGKSFTTRSNLVKHERVHTGEKPFSCSECGKFFTCSTNLVIHRKIHAREKPFSCNDCGKRFLKSTSLVCHQKTHGKRKCGARGLQLGRTGSVTAHVGQGEEDHGKNPETKEEEGPGHKPDPVTNTGAHVADGVEGLGHKPDPVTNMAAHVADWEGNRTEGPSTNTKAHTEETSFSCSECGKSFKYHGSLILHQRSHEEYNRIRALRMGSSPGAAGAGMSAAAQEKETYPCPVCGKSFTYKANCVRHQQTHSVVKHFACAECGACFGKKLHLLRHQRSHAGPKPFSCPDCGKCFKFSAGLLKHQEVHAGEKPFSCPACAKCFSKRSILLRHKKLHAGEKPFSCAERGQRQSSGPVTHRTPRADEKPFLCSECGESFGHRGGLTIHKKSHREKGDLRGPEEEEVEEADPGAGETERKTFPCPECGRRFKHNASRNRHRKTHAGQRPVSCPQCGKSFSHSTGLTSHLRTHSGEKPDSCCGKRIGGDTRGRSRSPVPAAGRAKLLKHQRLHDTVESVRIL